MQSAKVLKYSGKSTALLTVAVSLLIAGCAGPQDAPNAVTPIANQPGASQVTALPAAPPPQVSMADLIVGADWAAVRIEGIAALGTPVPRLRWLSATQVTGNGGCNQFAGKAVLTETEARLGPLASTRMMCLPTPSGQEDKFFKALEATTRARLERGVLVLMDAQGNELLRLNRQAR